MTRRKVDEARVERALEMRDYGYTVSDILAATGLAQGTYYKYVHARADSIDSAYASQPIAPMLTWPGSKKGELDELLPYVPEFSGTYVEPFLGSAAMFFALKPSSALLSDASPELMSFYGSVRDRFRWLKDELEWLEGEYAAADDGWKRKMYDQARDTLNGATMGDVSQAAAFYFVNKVSFSGLIRRNRRGEYNVPWGRGKGFNSDAVTELHSRALRDAELTVCDFEESLMRCTEDDFVFLDPPYDSEFSDYAGRFGEDEHRRLSEVFHELPCPALLVVSRTSLTLGLYGDDVIGEYVRHYNVNVRGRVSSTAVHLIVGHRL